MRKSFSDTKNDLTTRLGKRSRERLRERKDSLAIESAVIGRKNDLIPDIRLEQRKISELSAPKRNTRKRDAKHDAEIARAIAELGFAVPPIITPEGEIIDGVSRIGAAAAIGLAEVPCLVLSNASPELIRLLRLAINRLAEKGQWDLETLKLEFEGLESVDIPLTATGFTLPEIDIILEEDAAEDPAANKVVPVDAQKPAVTRPGDCWQMGRHRVLCADATGPESYRVLLGDTISIQAVFSDPPYNIPIQGFAVGNGSVKHREFAAASGEMTDEAFTAFLTEYLMSSTAYLVDGGVAYCCMDWRHVEHVLAAARAAGLAVLTIAVWSKGAGGLGGLYRSAHELVFVLKKGTGPILNNVELGKHGRDRTNVWVYPGANQRGSSANAELANHPTPKPVELVADAILDVTHRGEIVVDPFLGSGTTIIAAQKTGRTAYGLELDPLYVDCIVRRFEAFTGTEAIHLSTGKTFREMSAIREGERAQPEAETLSRNEDAMTGTITESIDDGGAPLSSDAGSTNKLVPPPAIRCLIANIRAADRL